MNILSLPSILALTINFSVALIVLMDRPKAVANRLFFAFILAFAVWNLGEILMINAAAISLARLGAHLISFGFFLTPALFLLITFYFPHPIERRFAPWPSGLCIPAIPVFVLLLSLPEPMMRILELPAPANIYFHALPSPRFWTFDGLALVSAVYLTWGVRNLLFSRRQAHSQRKRFQARLLIAGFLTIELLAIGINLLRTLLVPRRGFFFLSIGMSLVISGFFALAILRYRLLSLQRLLRRGLVYSVLSAIVLSVYFLLIRHAAIALSAGFGVHSALIDGFFIFLLVVLIGPLEDKVSQLLEHVVFTRRLQLRRQIADFSRNLLRYSDFDLFLHQLEEFLRSISGTRRVGIFIREVQTGKMLLHSNGRKARIEWPPGNLIFQRLARSDGPIEIEELETMAPGDEVVTSFAKMGYCQILPLRFDGNLLGMVTLEAKMDGTDYTVDELEVFGLLANEVSMALSRNLAFEESRAKEAQLQQADKLAGMGKLVAGVAHEIRNPLNVISSAAQTLKKKTLTEEERLNLIQFVVDETEQLNHLLSDFLRLARPRKPVPNRGRVDELLTAVAGMVRQQAKANRIEIVLPSDESEVETDFQMLEQVLVNLALNAIEAMPGGGTLTLEANLNVPGWLIVKVHDTGGGIPEEVRQRIFEPFFTTKEDGTGLGLSITYTLIEALGGRLRLQPAEGGTTFVVQVPISRRAQWLKNSVSW